MNDTPLAAKGAAHRAGDAPLLEIDGLHTYFDTLAGEVRSVHGVSYRVEAGQTVGVAVGYAVGYVVGERVGLDVGYAVGYGVGAVVGMTTHSVYP